MKKLVLCAAQAVTFVLFLDNEIEGLLLTTKDDFVWLVSGDHQSNKKNAVDTFSLYLHALLGNRRAMAI